MPLVTAYHRPESVDEALELLRSPNRVALAGGTVLNADREHSDLEVVDLQSLGLGGISTDSTTGEERVRLGATVTLDAASQNSLLPPALRELARAEHPSVLRTLATFGGLVATAPPESPLLAALLAHDCRVSTIRWTQEATDGHHSTEGHDGLRGHDQHHARDDHQGHAGRQGRDGYQEHHRTKNSLAVILSDGVADGTLITAVTLDPCGRTSFASTARTPADTPIVAAYGRQTDDAVTVAVSGVAAHPVVVDPADPIAGLSPVGDFRGSADYRSHLAGVLVARVVEGLSQ